MYEISYGRKFKTAYKKLNRSGKFNNDDLKTIIQLLSEGKELPEHYYDHFLKGPLKDKKECHINGNLLLIYDIDEQYKTIRIAEIGTHSELFKR